MTENNADTPMHLGNSAEQQRARRNLLRRTRYAQMSTERKALLLEQQQTRRAEAAKIRLLQEPNDSHRVSEISTHCSHSNIPPPSTCSVPTYQDSLAHEPPENAADTHTEFVHSAEQQRSRRNLLRCTRYAEMSAERKKMMLTQQQARRAEARKSRLSPKPNDTAGHSDVNSQCGQGNITPTSGSSPPTSADSLAHEPPENAADTHSEFGHSAEQQRS